MRILRPLPALWMQEHHVKASTIWLDAIGVVLVGYPQVATVRPDASRTSPEGAIFPAGSTGTAWVGLRSKSARAMPSTAGTDTVTESPGQVQPERFRVAHPRTGLVSYRTCSMHLDGLRGRAWTVGEGPRFGVDRTDPDGLCVQAALWSWTAPRASIWPSGPGSPMISQVTTTSNSSTNAAFVKRKSVMAMWSPTCGS
jgi:hypothetical protein